MQIVPQLHEILYITANPLTLIEQAGRTCYKSNSDFTAESGQKFAKSLLQRGHESVIEHCVATIKFITNRGVSHELVRHRLASFSQSSTRYIVYQYNIEFIKPVWWDDSSTKQRDVWVEAMTRAERAYCELRELGWAAEKAREVLPNSLKTEIVVTANLREWRHILKLRTSEKAHPQIRALMLPILTELQQVVPIIFNDIAGK